MKVPFGTITITQEAKRLVNEILDSGKVSSGKYVREFEEKFAQLIGTKEAVAVSTGTDADTLALALLYDYGACRGDEIIIPALSFVATGNAVLHAGFKPVFVDIERKTLNINPEKIEEVITSRTRAVMPVHLMGKPAAMDKINQIAKKHNLYVIEDAAEAHGAVYKGKNIGTWGDLSAFSLYVAHILSTVEGGIITTDNQEFAEVLRSLRSHGRFCKCNQCVLNAGATVCKKRFKDGVDQRFFFERVGYSSKMNELEVAIGLGSIDLFEEILAKRRRNLTYLLREVPTLSPYLFTFQEGEDEQIGPHAFPVILSENAPFTRDQLVSYLGDHQIDSRNLFLSIPTQCPGFKFLGHKLGDFSEAEYVASCGFHIGIHQDLNQDHMDYFLETVKNFLKENK